MIAASQRRSATQWVLWFAVLASITLVMWAVRDELDKTYVTLAFLLVVLGGSAAEGRALGTSLSVTAFLVFNWVFLPPYYSLVIANPLDWLVLLAFLVTGIVAAQLLERQRQATASAQHRADEIDRLATLGAETLNAPRAEDALDAIASVIRHAMGTDRCAIYQWDPTAGLRLQGHSPAEERTEEQPDLLAYTVTQGASVAERDDSTLTLFDGPLTAEASDTATIDPLSHLVALGIPLTVRGRVVGALRLASLRSFGLSEDQRRVLSALSYYAALGVERVGLTDSAAEAESLRRADRLKDALLASVSHDLRTPLTAIKGIANEVWHGGDPMRAQAIEQEADRLNELVDDLLELSQINAGVIRVAMALNTADDVVATALERVEAAHGTGRIEVQIATEGAMLVGEFDLMHTTRALTNLLENALKYSPAAAPVVLRVTQRGGRALFMVEDAGPGVAPLDEPRIFDAFYRGAATSDAVRGTGLGLAISRELIEAQGGTLRYEPRENGGSRFTIELPAVTAPPDVNVTAP